MSPSSKVGDLAAVGEVLVIARKEEDEVAGGADIEPGRAIRPAAARRRARTPPAWPAPRPASAGVAADLCSGGLLIGRSCRHCTARHASPGVGRESGSRADDIRPGCRRECRRSGRHATDTADTPPRRVRRRGRFPRGRCGRRRACISPGVWPAAASSSRHKSSLAIGTSLFFSLRRQPLAFHLGSHSLMPLPTYTLSVNSSTWLRLLERFQPADRRRQFHAVIRRDSARRRSVPAPCRRPDDAR